MKRPDRQAPLFASDPPDSGQKGKLKTRYLKTIRLAPPDDVRLTALEVAIIDTKSFQRLRQIRQLGPACWVYPTALHTRFDHSIGVVKVVDGMVAAIREIEDQVSPSGIENTPVICSISEQQRILARLYGLLHDITHVPFGHTLEDELRIFPAHDAFQKRRGSTDGRERFDELLGPSSEIGVLIQEHLDAAMYRRFSDIFLRGKFDRLPVEDNGSDTADEFIYYLVSDTVCADLIDYLKRDSYFSGLELRISTRLLNYMFIADVEQDELPSTTDPVRRRVVVRLWKARTGRPRRDIMTDIAGLIDSRYMLAERVYFHPAKVIVGTMIGRAALEAKLAGHLSTTDMLKFGDDTFLDFLRNIETRVERAPDDGEALALVAKLASAVVDRSLYKCLQRYPREKFDDGDAAESPFRRLIDAFKSAHQRRSVENEIAEIASVRPGDVLIYVAPEKMNLKVAEAVVDWHGARTILSKVKDEPVLLARLKSIEDAHERLWSADLIVNSGLSSEQKRKVQLAFEAMFFPRSSSGDKWELLLKRVVASDQRLANRDAAEVQTACELAAKDLADKRIAAHSGKAVDVMLEAVKVHLAS